MEKRVLCYGLSALLALPVTLKAALYDRGNGLIYDDVLNVTWLQDANYTAKELSETRVAEIIAAVPVVGEHQLAADDFHLHSDGNWYLTWWGALAWADQLAYAGYEDWRLPRTDFSQDGCTDSSCLTDGEPAHLYFTPPPVGLGEDISSGPFENIQPSVYWTGTESFVFNHPETDAWGFNFGAAWEMPGPATNRVFAWAVRDGDVLVTPVPPALPLFAPAVALLAVMRWKRRKPVS